MQVCHLMADVFISYSRQDQAFVRLLFGALEVAGQDAWVDWEDIPLTTDWWAEIREGIEEAKAFVFVMTPSSLASHVCTLEVSLALQLHKRIIPVLPAPFDTNEALEKLKARPVDPSLKGLVGARSLSDIASINWQTLSAINWVQFANKDFDVVTRQLLEVLQTDYDHAKTHTRLLQRALEWDRAKRPNTLLLRGDAQREAEAWVRYNADKIPKPSDIHREYVAGGIRLRQKEQGQLRNFIILLLVLLAMAIGAGVLAINRTRLAEIEAAERARQQQIAEENATAFEQSLRDQWRLQSLFLAGQSHLSRRESGDPTLFINLALESLKHYDEGIYRHEAHMMLSEALNHPLQLKAEMPDVTNVIATDTNSNGTGHLVANREAAYLWIPQAGTVELLTRPEFFDVGTAPQILGVAFTEDDTHAAVLTSDRSLLISLEGAGGIVEEVRYTAAYDRVRLSESGAWAWASIQQEEGAFGLAAWAMDGSAYYTLDGIRMLQEAYFSPDDRYLAIPAYADQTLLWDLRANTTRLLKGASYTPVRWAGNDVALVRDVHGTLRALRVSDETPTQLFFIGRVVNAVPSPDGTRIAVITSDQTVRVLNTETGQLENEMLLFEANASSIVWNDAQDHLMSWGRESIFLWALNDEFPQSVTFLGGAFGLFTDTHALVAGDRSISIIELYGGNAETVAYPATPILGMTWNPDSGGVLVRAGSDPVRLWSAGQPPQPRLIPADEAGELTEILPCHPQILGNTVGVNKPEQTTCSADFRLIAGTLPDKGEIWVWELDDPSEPIWVFPAPYPVRAMHFSPDATRLAVVDSDFGRAHIYTVGLSHPIEIDSFVDGDSLRWTEDGSAVRLRRPYTGQTEEWLVDVRQLIALGESTVFRPLNEAERIAFFIDITD